MHNKSDKYFRYIRSKFYLSICIIIFQNWNLQYILKEKKKKLIPVVHLWRKQSIKEEGSKNVKKPNRFRGVSGEI